MADINQRLSELWKNWKIEKIIGEGSFGKVYKIVRTEYGKTYDAALKVIEVPESYSEVETVKNDGMDDESVTLYFQSIVEDIIDEFAIMSKLKGNSNIVSYEDHAVVKKKDEFGWEIYIRMELLTPFLKYLGGQTLTIRQIINLGIDICKALEVCQKYNIIHRDIKPENIFVSNLGQFKLGDFGISKQLEKTKSALSKKGTPSYMAPEVYKGEKYGSNVDIYSLGMVLYKYLNNNRIPFVPPYPQHIKYSDQENANIMRIGGKELPPPCNANGRLAEIVLKACAYQPKDRYESAGDFRRALEAIACTPTEEKIIYPLSEELHINGSTNSVSIQEAIKTATPKVKNQSLDVVADTTISMKEFLKEQNLDNNENQHTSNGNESMQKEEEKSNINYDKTVSIFDKTDEDTNGKEVKSDEETIIEEEVKNDEETIIEEEVKNDEEKTEVEPPPIPLPRKKKKIIPIVVTVGVCVAVGIGATFALLKPSQPQPEEQPVAVESTVIEIPDLTNLTVQEAESNISGLNVGVQVENMSYSDSIAKDRIISQDFRDNVVYVVVSSGEKPIKIPSLVKLKKETAKSKLKKLGLKCKIITAYSSSVSKGRVVKQSVKTGKQLKKGATITLTVSKGAKPKKYVPSTSSVAESVSSYDYSSSTYTPSSSSTYTPPASSKYVAPSKSPSSKSSNSGWENEGKWDVLN